MMASRACVASWDNSTRGLDASTALDYAKSLRILTDVFKMTTFVSLYQAGEGIYEQFDKVLVIDAGRQVYFGPAQEARGYFLGLGYRDLPRQTSQSGPSPFSRVVRRLICSLLNSQLPTTLVDAPIQTNDSSLTERMRALVVLLSSFLLVCRSILNTSISPSVCSFRPGTLRRRLPSLFHLRESLC
jgi:ABC-type multidrug transport system ATPase subunit